MPETALKPADMSLPNEIENSANIPELYKLNEMQKIVLARLCRNLVSETTETDTKIAKDLGIDRKTIYLYRKNPDFGAALVKLMQICVTGLTDTVLRNLVKQSETKTKAAEILLRISELYTPKSANLNVNANITSSLPAGATSETVIDTFLVKLLDLGWSPSRIAERAQELQRGG